MIDLPFGEWGDNYNSHADVVQFQPITIDAAAVTEILQRHPLVPPLQTNEPALLGPQASSPANDAPKSP
jgi:hypothetical protein